MNRKKIPMPEPRTGEHPDPLRYSGADFVKQFESDYSFSFDQSLRDCIAIAFDASKKPEGDPLGVTTDRVFVSMLIMGKQRPELAPKAARIYQALGETDFEKLKLMLTPAGVPSHEVEIELEDGPKVVSDTFRIFLDTAWKNREPKSKKLTLDQLADQFIRDPGHVSMRYLFGQTSEKWEDVADTILHLAQASDLPEGHLTAGSARMSDWTNHLESRYNARFSPDGVELIAAAAAQSQRIPERRPSPSGILNTRDFLPPMLNDSQLLKSLRLNSSMSVLRGGTPPPWVEKMCDRDSNPDSQLAPGNLPFSRYVEEALKGAAKLAASTPDYPSINKWHISGAIIASHAPGIRTALADGGTNIDQAIKVLLVNLDEHSPQNLESVAQSLTNSDLGSTLVPPLAGTDIPSELEASVQAQRLENSIEPMGHFARTTDWTPIEQRIEKLRCNERTITYVMEMRELCRNHGYTRSLTIEALYSSLLAWDDSNSVFQNFRQNVSDLDQETHRREFLSTCIHVDDPENFSGVLFVTDPVYEIFETARMLAEQRSDPRIDPIDIMVVLLVPPKDLRKPAWWFNSFFERENPRLRKEFSAALRLHSREASTPFWLNLVESPESMIRDPLGSIFQPKREANDQELCLDVDSYAQAVAQLLRDADMENDFVLAIYGPWGRGKTTLIRKVKPLLAPSSNSAEAGSYAFVDFSAWKYPTRPEVWIHLYEQIAQRAIKVPVKPGKAEAATGKPTPATKSQEDDASRKPEPFVDSFWQKSRLAFRMGLLRSGWSPLLTGLIFLFITRLPLVEAVEWLRIGLGGFGALLLIGFAFSAFQFGRRLRMRYLSLPDHSESLGMQAVIGRDLANLLQVWLAPASANEPIPGQIDFRPGKPGFWGTFCVVLLIAATFVVAGLRIPHPEPTQGGSSEEPAGATTTPSNPPQAPDTATPETPTKLTPGTSMPASNEAPLPAEVAPTPATSTPAPVEATAPAEAAEAAPAPSPAPPDSQIRDLLQQWVMANPPLDTLQGPTPNIESETPPSPLAYWISISVLSLAGTALIYFFISLSRPLIRHEKLLLTIDDLDRCEPDQMLAVIESLRLFLDNVQISRRLQVVMLVDQRFLGNALLKRARENGLLLSPKSQVSRRYVREQREKFFVAELGLPQISPENLSEMIDKHLRPGERDQTDPLAQPSVATSPSQVDSKASGDTYSEERQPDLKTNQESETLSRNPTNPGTVSDPPLSQPKDSTATESPQTPGNTPTPDAAPIGFSTETIQSVRFSMAERDHLLKAIPEFHQNEVTPRQIRASVVRYQLARMLLLHLGRPMSEDSVSEILEAIGSQLNGTAPTNTETVVTQVAHAVVCPDMDYAPAEYIHDTINPS
jgi:hypothetical protein